MNLNEIEKCLLDFLVREGSPLPEGELIGMIELVRAGEPGIALENFCTQLFEYDVKVSPMVLNEIASLGIAMGINSRYWERLETHDVS
jgi:hypothetical protein